MLYRIYTEDKNREAIEKICSEVFDGFTIIHANGYYKGIKENTIIIEIVVSIPDLRAIKYLADNIKRLNHQESVLITCNKIDSQFI
jgi:hypothetical protein